MWMPSNFESRHWKGKSRIWRRRISNVYVCLFRCVKCRHSKLISPIESWKHTQPPPKGWKRVWRLWKKSVMPCRARMKSSDFKLWNSSRNIPSWCDLFDRAQLQILESRSASLEEQLEEAKKSATTSSLNEQSEIIKEHALFVDPIIAEKQRQVAIAFVFPSDVIPRMPFPSQKQRRRPTDRRISPFSAHQYVYERCCLFDDILDLHYT